MVSLLNLRQPLWVHIRLMWNITVIQFRYVLLIAHMATASVAFRNESFTLVLFDQPLRLTNTVEKPQSECQNDIIERWVGQSIE